MAQSSSMVRLYVDAELSAGDDVDLGPDSSHYLTNVLRLALGAPVRLFNGRDGEWVSRIESIAKRAITLHLIEQCRPQAPEPDIWLAFSPIKKSRTDFAVEKATELGITRLMPVITQFTSTRRVNSGRLAATAKEAAEQCHRLSVPNVDETRSFSELLAEWPRDRQMYALDETGSGRAARDAFQGPPGPVGFVTGPEGGFSESELDLLRALDFVTLVSLGPRILRAETAVVAALSAYQAIVGDWH